jgi:hypothetical protein
MGVTELAGRLGCLVFSRRKDRAKIEFIGKSIVFTKEESVENWSEQDSHLNIS